MRGVQGGSSLARELRLWQLVSPALPVGAFAWSDGLEPAVARGDVVDEPSARAWIEGVLRAGVGSTDVPALAAMHRAWRCGDVAGATRHSARLVARRDTAELRASDRHTGQALARLLCDLGHREAQPWVCARHTSLAAMFALAASRAGVGAERAAAGYLWSWLENQVAAAIKLVPLGQTAGQRVLAALVGAVEEVALTRTALDADAAHAETSGLSMASAEHEIQYTRLFRS